MRLESCLLLAVTACATSSSGDPGGTPGGDDDGTTIVDTTPTPYDPLAHVAELNDPHAQPALRARDQDTGVTWVDATGPLLDSDGPWPEDVNQHGGADCYFLATLGALAWQQPDVIRALIESRADGTFVVHFVDTIAPQDPTSIAPLQPIDVAVDSALPERNGKLIYSDRRPADAIWPELVEKAYAKLHGGYDNVLNEGHARNAFRATAGWNVNRVAVAPSLITREDLYDQIAAGLAAGAAIDAGTPRGTPPAGLVGAHDYTVLDAEPDADGRLWLELRNPWGHFEPGSDGTDDGIFWIRTVDLQAGFDYVFIAAPTATTEVVSGGDDPNDG